MRKESVLLEDGVDRAQVGRLVAHLNAVDVDLAAGRVFKSRNHPERGGLAAPAGPKERQELSRPHRERDAVDGHHVAKALCQLHQLDQLAAIVLRQVIIPPTGTHYCTRFVPQSKEWILRFLI